MLEQAASFFMCHWWHAATTSHGRTQEGAHSAEGTTPAQEPGEDEATIFHSTEPHSIETHALQQQQVFERWSRYLSAQPITREASRQTRRGVWFVACACRPA